MNSKRRKVVFRTDGNSSIGLGHIVRCCALADMLKEHFDCSFYIRGTSKEVLDDINKYCTSVFEIDNTNSHEEEASIWINVLHGDEIVVLDGYYFNTAYQSYIKSKGCKLVCIDDIHESHFVADVVINYTPGVLREEYSFEAYTNLYLGTEYALLRKPFLENAKSKKLPGGTDLFLCMGGADPQNNTLQILQVVLGLHPANLNIIVGSAYKYLTELKNFLHLHKGQFNIFQNISAGELVKIMLNSSIAICTPSTLAFEYLSLVNGKLYLKTTADNQRNFFNFLINRSIAFPIEDFISSKNVVPNYPLQNHFFDGLQGERYMKIFNSL